MVGHYRSNYRSTLVKIKIYSWILAGAYLLCGTGFFYILLKFTEVFSGFNIPLPAATRMMLAIGPFGWLFFSAAAGLAVIQKDVRFGSRIFNLNPFLTFALVFWVSFMVFAFLYPITTLCACIH
jgi:hypothetical protein